MIECFRCGLRVTPRNEYYANALNWEVFNKTGRSFTGFISFGPDVRPYSDPCEECGRRTKCLCLACGQRKVLACRCGAPIRA